MLVHACQEGRRGVQGHGQGPGQGYVGAGLLGTGVCRGKARVPAVRDRVMTGRAVRDRVMTGRVRVRVCQG